MPSEGPLVSIVTPSYNQGRFIEDTLKCVRTQTYDDIEHVVFDGESTDETVDVLREYEDTYDLRWTSESDDGQSDAINKGFQAADGEIVGWLNSDDLYFRDTVVEAVVETFSRNPDASIVYGDALFVDADLRPLFVRKRRYWNRDRFLRGWTIPQPAIFFRKEVVEQELLDESLEYVMDLEFWLRIFERFESTYIDRIVGVDRLHEDAKRLASDPAEFDAELQSALAEYGREESIETAVMTRLDYLYLGAMRVWGLLEALVASDGDDVNVDLRSRNKLQMLVPGRGP